MNIGKACGIFKQIESDKYTDIEKTIAIDSVLNMETHNGVTKDEILRKSCGSVERTLKI